MKDEKGMRRSRNARFNQAAAYAEQVLELLTKFHGLHDAPIYDAETWPALREAAEKCLKCIHEANAYNNALSERARDGEGTP